MLDILYKDLEIIAINKPHGLLVHRSSIAADTSEFALQLLRDQIGQAVYPAHRLDRKTAGALLFSLTKEMDSQLQNLFATRQTNKTYWAIVRGYTEDTFSVDYPLKKRKWNVTRCTHTFPDVASRRAADTTRKTYHFSLFVG